MIYTFAISFNGSDYQSITPAQYPVITTEKEADEYIWRSKMDDLKITKAENSSVYDTLETWWGDSTKYDLNIKLRIQKSAVTKWEFIFGIKQGVINYENKYYEITPEPYDEYTDFYGYKGERVTNANPKSYIYVNEDDIDSDGVDEIYKATQYRYYDWVNACKTKVNTALGDTIYSIQSAFLWGDAYPDGGSYTSLPTLSSDFAVRQSDGGAGYISIEDILQIPKDFQCYHYIASDYTLHFEHVGWFYNQISDYQLDLTGSDYYDDARRFRHSNAEYYGSERFVPVDDSIVLTDFSNAYIWYDKNRVAYRNDEREYRSDYQGYITSDFADKFKCIGDTNLCIGWQDLSTGGNAWTSWTHSSDSADITAGEASASDHIAYTNFLAPAGTTASISYDIDLTFDGVPGGTLAIQGYTDTTPNGSEVNLSGGSNTGSVNGNRLRIRSTGALAFSFTITLTISNYYRIPWEEGGASGTFMQNMAMSWGNILREYWTYDRYARKGNIMGESETTFDSVKFLKEQDDFKFYYASDLNPMRGIKTDYGTGMIQKIERDLATDFITLSLRYE